MAASSDPSTAHARAAQTKKARTRTALIGAAEALFAERGWSRARLEDIAQAAGVSVPTAYNHFPGGKQELIGSAYAPLLAPLMQEAQADIAAGRDAGQAVARHVRRLVTLARRSKLTLPMLTAAFEQMLRAGPPTGPRDVRTLVPLADTMTNLISYGQERGEFHPVPSPADVATYHINALLIRLMSRPKEPEQDTANLAVNQLLLALGANCPQVGARKPAKGTRRNRE